MSESGLGSPAAVSTPSRLSLFLDRAGLQGFPWVSAIVLYTISWGWILIVRDSYWNDDWGWFAFSELGKFDLDDIGLAPWWKLIEPLYQVVGATGMRILTFASYFLCGMFAFGIAGRFRYFSGNDRKFLALFFLILPFNSARVALMVTHYTVSVLLFFAAWFLLLVFESGFAKIVAFLFFFLSFLMHSLLFFYALPMLSLLFVGSCRSKKELKAILIRNAHFMMLPLLYLLIRSIYWPEKVRYHNFDIQRLGNLPSISIFLLLVIASIFYITKKSINGTAIWVFVFGLTATFFAMLPYSLIGIYGSRPDEMVRKFLILAIGRSDFYSRHQTLQPLGISLLIVSVIIVVSRFGSLARRALISSITLVCLVFNLGFGLENVTDFAKQGSIVAELKNHRDSVEISDYEFIDQTYHLNARGRRFRTWDWWGLVGQAYGTGSAAEWNWTGEDNILIKNLKTVRNRCSVGKRSRLVLIQGPETHWQALKNWVRDRDMGFKVTIDDTPGACKPELVTAEKVSGAIPILFYFTGAKN